MLLSKGCCMSYWVYNDYNIVFDNEVVEGEFWCKLIKWCEVEQPEGVNWQGIWLGSIAIGAGVYEAEKYAEWKTDMACAGTISDIELDGDTLSFTSSTKYESDKRLWEEIIGRYCKGAKVLYSSVGEDSAYLITNEDDYVGRYVVDIQDCDELQCILESDQYDALNSIMDNDTYKDDVELKQLIEIARLFGYEEGDLEQFIEDASDNCICISKWEYEKFCVKE